MRPPKHRWTVKDAKAHLRHAIDQLVWLEEHADRVWYRGDEAVALLRRLQSARDGGRLGNIGPWVEARAFLAREEDR